MREATGCPRCGAAHSPRAGCADDAATALFSYLRAPTDEERERASLHLASLPRAVDGVTEQVDWAQVHRTTRTEATATAFGWRVRLLLCLPPLLPLAFWAKTGALIFAAPVGLLMIWATGWWIKQVWKATRVTGRPPPLSP